MRSDSFSWDLMIPDLSTNRMPLGYSKPLLEDFSDWYIANGPEGLYDSETLAWLGIIFPTDLGTLTEKFTPKKGRQALQNIRDTYAWHELTVGEANLRDDSRLSYKFLTLNGESLAKYLRSGDTDAPTTEISISDSLVTETYNNRLEKIGVPEEYQTGRGREALDANHVLIRLLPEFGKKRMTWTDRNDHPPIDVNPLFYVPVSVSHKDKGWSFTGYILHYNEPGGSVRNKT